MIISQDKQKQVVQSHDFDSVNYNRCRRYAM